MDQITAILDRLLALHPKEIDLSLGRMHRLLTALGSPEQKLPPSIHIAGTNGKGSVAATLRAMLEAGGKRCHVYTSPHLVSFNERIRLGADGKYVSDPKLFEALYRCEEANGGEEITFFEITTAAALLLFSEEPADILLLEVGLGGRLDATNVIDAPLATVITPISMDHEKFLGEKIEDIAAEKAGVLKSGCPAIVAPQDDAVLSVLERTAARLKVPLYRFGQEFHAYPDQGRLAFQDDDSLSDLPLSSLAGTHQVINAGVAIATLKASGLWQSDDSAARGLKSVNWPGRLQSLKQGSIVEKCPDGAEIWLDGGHNPGAGLAIAAFMGEQEERAQRPLYMIAGMLTTKDPIGFFRAFQGLVRHIVTVPISSTNTARDPVELAAFAREAGIDATPSTSLGAALADIAALSNLDEDAPRILFCGSLYLAGEVLAMNGMMPD